MSRMGIDITTHAHTRLNQCGRFRAGFTHPGNRFFFSLGVIESNSGSL